tara:strand:+ start:395 stop:550 length:156 start_codon:yes stop_codon:yes gene_type:complete
MSLDRLDKIVVEIDKKIDEMKAIQNGAIVNPKTNEILRDKNGNIVYYKEKK